MGITDNYVPVKQSGNGVTTQFSGLWNMINADYSRVYWEDKTTGVQTLKIKDTHYTLAFTSSGFTVTFLPGFIPPSTVWVVIGREVTIDQNVPYRTASGFQGSVQENSFDKLTAICQDIQEQVDRSVKVPLGGGELVFPAYSAGILFGWSATDANVIENSTVTIAEVEGAIEAVAALTAQSGVKVSANDTTVGFLNGKLLAGQNIDLVEGNDGGNETLTINVENLMISDIVDAGTMAGESAADYYNVSEIAAAFANRVMRGLIMANNATDATNDIDVSVGFAFSDDASPADMLLASAITKRLDAAWAVGTNQGGLDTGSIADTTYHVYLIKRPDTGVVDVLFSTSASAPTMPANYTKKKRIGSIVRSGSTIRAFKQRDMGGGVVRTDWSVCINDVNNGSPGTSANTATLSVPTGIEFDAIIYAYLETSSGGAHGLVTPLDITDTTPTAVLYNMVGDTSESCSRLQVKTNTSAQVRYRQNSGNSPNVKLTTHGFIDARVS